MKSFVPEVEDAVIKSQDRFVWEAPAYAKYDRGPKWYLIMALAAVALISYAIYTANFLFAFIILLMGILLLLVGNKDPERVLVQVGENGIVWNGRLMLFQDLEHFGLVYQPPYTKILYVEAKSPVMPRLRIDLEDQDPIELRTHLRKFMKEDADLQNEYLSDIFARLLRI